MRTKKQHNLGECCACGGTANVRNVLMLGKKAPIPGTGWGCVVCGLPMDGAVAVLCDGCLADEKKPMEACYGFPYENNRVSVNSLKGSHEHDMEKHEKDN